MDKFIYLAKEAVKTYVKNRQIIKPPSPLPEEFNRRAGVFVSIHKIIPFTQFTSSIIKERFRGTLNPPDFSDGYQPTAGKKELRGCIGTYLPVRKSIAEEIIHNAVNSASRDPRFPPITIGELPQLKYSIDILSIPENVIKNDDLDVKKYGLIVSTPDGRRGLLLPDLEGVESIQQQINICKTKAGIFANEKTNLQRFTVERHE